LILPKDKLETALTSGELSANMQRMSSGFLFDREFASIESCEEVIVEIKQSKWFAAGPEVKQALLSLSDGAFRQYFYLCLNARRDTGCISINYKDLAGVLGKSRRSIVTHFEELRRLGICRLHPATNQHQRTEVEICDDYWSYTKSCPVAEPSEYSQYFVRIKNLLVNRVCIQIAVSGADEKFARDLYARQVPIGQIERAIALGCCRKYVSMLNGTNSGPIFSLAYFRDLIEEVGDPDVPSGYWSYIMPELKHLEKKWAEKQNEAAGAKSAPAAGPED